MSCEWFVLVTIWEKTWIGTNGTTCQTFCDGVKLEKLEENGTETNTTKRERLRVKPTGKPKRKTLFSSNRGDRKVRVGCLYSGRNTSGETTRIESDCNEKEIENFVKKNRPDKPQGNDDERPQGKW